MKYITVLGTAIAALLLSTPLAIAQGVPEAAPDDCYVEWESNVRVNLQSLCSGANPTAGTQPATGAVDGRSPSALSAPAAATTLTVRVVSDVGSTVYSNGVSSSRRYIPQPLDQTTYAFPPGTLQPNPPSRRYTSYQIFYPSPYFRQGRFGYRRPPFSPLPQTAPGPIYYNPSSVPIIDRGAAIIPPVLIPESQQQRIRY